MRHVGLSPFVRNPWTLNGRPIRERAFKPKYLSEGLNGNVSIMFTWIAYVSMIETPTVGHMASDNKVEVPKPDDQYLQGLFFGMGNFMGL